MKFKLIRLGLYFVMGVSLLATGFAISLYVNNFHDAGFSTSPEDWAHLGSYFGGILTPLLTAINICVFVLLTLVIQNATDKSNSQAIESSRRVALMSMKHEELSHFKLEMDSSIHKCRNGGIEKDDVQELLTAYNVLEYRMLFLFPELNELDSNKKLRSYIVAMFDATKNSNNATKGHLIPISNVYGMLVSDLSRLVVE